MLIKNISKKHYKILVPSSMRHFNAFVIGNCYLGKYFWHSYLCMHVKQQQQEEREHYKRIKTICREYLINFSVSQKQKKKIK